MKALVKSSAKRPGKITSKRATVALRVDVHEAATYRRGKKDPVSQMLLKIADEKYGGFLRKLNALVADFNQA